MTAAARAHSNIALIKYCGKRATRGNLPAVGSISITLETLYTDTRVTFVENTAADTVELNGVPIDSARISAFLDAVRARGGLNARAHIVAHNNFPTGAGLASSASGFAALALAASRAAGLQLDDRELSILARCGSGSSARSIFGGFVEMHRGVRADGQDAYAQALLGPEAWPLEVVIAITAQHAKAIDSSAGMRDLAQRSDYYDAWAEHAENDLAGLRAALAARDFATLGALTEMSCLKLHGLMLSTRPGLIYWNPATVAAMHAVRALRVDGVPVYFTIDAGPQVKAICAPGHGDTVAAALAQVPGVLETRRTGLGPAATILGSA